MSSEWCPRCQALRSVSVSTSQRQVTDAHGKTLQIATNSYTCETCGATLRSEDVEQPSRDDLDESAQEG